MFRSWIRRAAAVAAAFFFSAALADDVLAVFHQWAIKEVFTSPDGVHQFVELFTSAPGEGSLNSHNIVITSDGNAKTITFNHNLANPTTDKHFLVATAGFGSLPGGVTPDFTPMEGNLFDPNAANITFDFAHGFDILEVTGSQIPKDGVNSLKDSDTTYFGPDVLSTGPNSPTNYAGAEGGVNLGGGTPTPGNFNGDSVVDGADLTIWRNNFGAGGTPTVSQGNADADGDVDGRDFLVWQRNAGPASAAAAAAAIPEPAGAALASVAAIALTIRRTQRRRS
jgi:hypothetical protein